MTSPPTTDELNEDEEFKEALAVLISCTRSKRRPLPLTDIAKWLNIAIAKVGSYSALGERVGLSGKMLRQFATVNELTRPVKDLFAKRQLDSVDAAVHLAMLSSGDQEVVGNALASQTIRTSDVRAIVQLRQYKRKSSIKSLLRQVVDSKTKQEHIAEFVIRGGRSHAELMKAFKRYVPSKEIIRLELQGALGRLVLTDEGKRLLLKAAASLGTSLPRVIPSILEKHFSRS